jgi:hypothetical protein
VNEGKSALLNISASAAETDQNAPTILISGVPSDASLSAGTNNHDGTWSLTAAQLANLSLKAAGSTDSIFTLTVHATDTETGAETQRCGRIGHGHRQQPNFAEHLGVRGRKRSAGSHHRDFGNSQRGEPH